MKALYLLCPALLVCAAPALAQVVVASPQNNARLVSPFWLGAWANPCSSQAISAMGYSLDNSSSTTIVNGNVVGANVYANLGWHTLHVKSWGASGASCVSDVAIDVVSSPVNSVPSNALVSKEIQSWNGWLAVNDTGSGPGWSEGTTALSSSLSLSGHARQFATTYTNYGGERYYLTIGRESWPKNFLYDTWVYLASTSTGIANIEMDMNEVIWNGDTVIFGVQCDGYSNTWDYTANKGTPANYVDTWQHSTAYCNPRDWTPNMWHHIQAQYSRDSVGNVTYKTVWLDGVEQFINATAPSAFSLGWGNAVVTNFQVDGLGASGSATVYADHMTVYRW